MNAVIRVQILVEVVCISHNANTLGKDMYSTALPEGMSK